MKLSQQANPNTHFYVEALYIAGSDFEGTVLKTLQTHLKVSLLSVLIYCINLTSAPRTTH